jgi:hypothetical protein
MEQHIQFLNRIQTGLRSNLNNMLSLDDYVITSDIDFDLNIKNFIQNIFDENKSKLYINNDIIQWCGYDLNINDFLNIFNIYNIKYIKTDTIDYQNVKILNSHQCLTNDNKHVILGLDEFKNFIMSMDTLKGNRIRLYYFSLKDILLEYNAYVNAFKTRAKKISNQNKHIN